MTNSRQKGKRGELEARDAVRQHWAAPECIRAAQVCGKFGADLLNALPHGHVEVKRYKAIKAFDFYEQAKRDAKSDQLPVVIMREDNAKEWLVMFSIEDSLKFALAILENFEKNSYLTTHNEEPRKPDAGDHASHPRTWLDLSG
jgi:hypothetical protein